MKHKIAAAASRLDAAAAVLREYFPAQLAGLDVLSSGVTLTDQPRDQATPS
ncbi:hypothetical protein [Castellaniella sp.]|uniref:hypothetical protein n=1 Tax=Castellaniella sp. TaxID=1955812 RepID=UPI002AFE2736|nr:hypothetical protein [Castellaniella sp.]